MRSIGSQYGGRGKLGAFFFCKKSWGTAQPEQKIPKSIDRAANRAQAFKGYLFKLELLNSP
jgi:hypothetical protein